MAGAYSAASSTPENCRTKLRYGDRIEGGGGGDGEGGGGDGGDGGLGGGGGGGGGGAGRARKETKVDAAGAVPLLRTTDRLQ